MAVTPSKIKKATAAGKRSKAASANGGAKAKGATSAEVVTLATGEGKPQGPSQFKKQQLLQGIEGQTSLNRKELREVTDLVLAEIGKALQAGHPVNLPPLGKITIKRRNEAQNGDILITRIKLMGPPADPAEE